MVSKCKTKVITIPLSALPISIDDENFVKDNFKEYRGLYEEEKWEKSVSRKYGLVIKDYEFPEQYEVKEDHYDADRVLYETISKSVSDLMVLIPNDYPAMCLDMFYFNPELQRKDGGRMNGLSEEIHFGSKWQRWSRHYDWDPVNMDLAFHLHYIDEAIKQNQDYIKEMQY